MSIKVEKLNLKILNSCEIRIYTRFFQLEYQLTEDAVNQIYDEDNKAGKDYGHSHSVYRDEKLKFIIIPFMISSFYYDHQ